MGRSGLLILCVFGLLAGVAWALHSHQPAWVTLGIVVLMLALMVASVRITAGQEGD